MLYLALLNCAQGRSRASRQAPRAHVQPGDSGCSQYKDVSFACYLPCKRTSLVLKKPPLGIYAFPSIKTSCFPFTLLRFIYGHCTPACLQAHTLPLSTGTHLKQSLSCPAHTQPKIQHLTEETAFNPRVPSSRVEQESTALITSHSLGAKIDFVS